MSVDLSSNRMRGTARLPVRVLDRGMRLVSCLADHPDGLTLTELSRVLSLDMATLTRFLRTLSEGAWVVQGTPPDRRWRLGSEMHRIGARARGGNDLQIVARPIMEAVMWETGQTVQLAVLSDDEVVYLEKVEPPDMAVRINSRVGSRRPIHCTALGKALTCERPWPEVEAVLRAVGMPAYTDATLTEPAAFAVELEGVRAAGHAVDAGEYNALVACCAAPVRDASGTIVAGLSVSSVGVDRGGDRFANMVSAARDGARRISESLGQDMSDDWTEAAHDR